MGIIGGEIVFSMAARDHALVEADDLLTLVFRCAGYAGGHIPDRSHGGEIEGAATVFLSLHNAGETVQDCAAIRRAQRDRLSFSLTQLVITRPIRWVWGARRYRQATRDG
jgi:hypothetical protein